METKKKRTQRAVGYCRVSTEDQATKGVSLEAQAAKVKSYCELYDLELIDIIEDAGISGKTLNRPGIQKVLEMCRKGDIDAVIIFKLDRLSRRTCDILALADTVFSKGKVSLHSICEQLNTTTAAGRLVLTVLAGMAQWERETIGERTSVALQHKMERNEYIGGHRMYGTIVQDDGKLQPDADEQEVIDILVELKGRGYSFRQIAAELNRRGVPSATGKTWYAPAVRNVYLRAAA